MRTPLRRRRRHGCFIVPQIYHRVVENVIVLSRRKHFTYEKGFRANVYADAARVCALYLKGVQFVDWQIHTCIHTHTQTQSNER